MKFLIVKHRELWASHKPILLFIFGIIIYNYFLYITTNIIHSKLNSHFRFVLQFRKKKKKPNFSQVNNSESTNSRIYTPISVHTSLTQKGRNYLR